MSGGEVGIGNEHGDEVRPAVAEYHRLGDFRLERQIAFNVRRRDRLAAGIFDEVALAVGDPDIAVVIEEADIAGLEPAVFEGSRGRFRVVPVALHDVVAGHQDLTISGDLDPDPVEWRPDGIDLDAQGRVASDDRSRLGLAVALQQPDPERQKEAADFGVERRAPRHHGLEPAAEASAQFGPNEIVEQRIEEPLAEGQRLRGQPLAPYRRGLVEYSPRENALALDTQSDAPMQGFVESGNRGHDRRPRFEHVGGERFCTFGKVDLGAERDREHQPRGVLVGMRQRQEIQKHLVAEAEGFEQAIGAVAIGDNVAMTGHHPFGDAARPRSVDQAGGIVGLKGGGRFRGGVGPLAAARQHLLPGQDVDGTRLACCRLDRDDGVHGRDLVRRGEHSGRERRL